MKQRSIRRGGFTIIEVMLAMVIIGIGLVVLLTVTSQCMQVARKAKEFEIARKLLSTIDLDFPIQLDELEEGTDGDSFKDKAFSDFSWEREIVLNGLEEDEMYLVTTRVLWKSRQEQEVEEVQTLLHLPTALKLGFLDDEATGRE